MKTIIILLTSILLINHASFATNVSYEAEMSSSPYTIVIFGATGDLAARKLFPAIYNLEFEGHIDKNTTVIGVGRSPHDNESFRQHVYNSIQNYSTNKLVNQEVWEQVQKRVFYFQLNEQESNYNDLKETIQSVDQQFHNSGNHLYYLALPPEKFISQLHKLKRNLIHPKNQGISRIIIEKPFGTDFDSAKQLHEEITNNFDSNQIYLIDHYLGKEAVQNLLTLRFENILFEPLWNKNYIDNIQITLSEEIGIGTRGKFWESTGSLRDVVQNHLLQLLAIIAIEPPASLSSEDVKQAKIKLLNAIQPLSTQNIDNDIIRAQYGPGIVNGVEVTGYTEENGVSPQSTSETFFAAKLFIDTPRWSGVPFYLRAGKRLAEQTTEIVITFKPTPLTNSCNALIIRIQPKPAIYMQTFLKSPSFNKKIELVLFGLDFDSHFKKRSAEAYEKLIYDAIQGDTSLFVDPEEHLAAWRWVTPILEHWKSQPRTSITTYPSGTWGPVESNYLLEKNGHEWQAVSRNNLNI